jgi:hypothetical protein
MVATRYPNPGAEAFEPRALPPSRQLTTGVLADLHSGILQTKSLHATPRRSYINTSVAVAQGMAGQEPPSRRP